jgi:glutaminyl-tRNA synthetase
VIDVSLLEFCLREDLNKRVTRVMGVTNPLKVTIINYPEGQVEWMDAVNNPEDCMMGTRKVPFSRVIYIEQEDFMENPTKKYFRLSPGAEVRLRYAYLVKCEDIVKNSKGEIIELKCSYDPESKGGNSPDGRKVKGTIHWVSVEHALEAEIRLYDRLFLTEDPENVGEGLDYKSNLNPESLKVHTCYIEPSVKDAVKLDKFQFERVGYFSVDYDSTPGHLVFNRVVTLKDSWSKIAGKE